ncbi:MAG: hypothetical protein V1753_01755, partial [Pseudomonadota bacterium]
MSTEDQIQPTLPEAVSNRFVYVALFDILGFSELVKKNELSRVADTYFRAMKAFKDILSDINAMNQAFKMDVVIEYRSFSDTFLIYTSTTGERAFLSLLAACDGLFIGAIENKLLIRGAITCGELIAQTGLEIGQPIVDAYRSEQRQDWSGCWITDQCLEGIKLSMYLKDRSLVRYKIPLKDGEVKTCVAFNWVKSLAWKARFENRKNDFELEQIKRHLNFIYEEHNDWKIRRKLDNTK